MEPTMWIFVFLTDTGQIDTSERITLTECTTKLEQAQKEKREAMCINADFPKLHAKLKK